MKNKMYRIISGRAVVRGCTAVALAALLAVSMSGCEGEGHTETWDGKGGSGKGYEKDQDGAADEWSGADAYRRVSACGEYHFDQTDKVFCDGKNLSGEWVKTDERSFGEENPNNYEVRRWGMEDSYPAGGRMDADITFAVEAAYTDPGNSIWGTMYFADPGSVMEEWDDDLIVRKYFMRSQNNEVNDPIEMSRFGAGNDGRQGGGDGQNGGKVYYFEPTAVFPRLGEDGDMIYAVLDISDAEGETLTRYLWEYTFKITKGAGDDGRDENEEDDHSEDYPEYYSVEHPGHWDMTDIRFVGGGDGEEVKDGDDLIIAERYGVEGEDMIYTYPHSDGSYRRIRMAEIYPDTRVYGDDILRVYIRNTAYNNTGDASEDADVLAHCSLALADVDFDKGDYGVKVHPRMYFSSGYTQGETQTFDAPGKLSLEGTFPVGEKDGEKIYLVYGVMDSLSGRERMYNVYEYTWREGPETEWVYNPPMY